MTIKITRDVNLDEKSIHIEDNKLAINVSANPDNKLKKTENGLEVLASSGSGLELGNETKTIERVVVNGDNAELIFTEVLNHNQPNKRMFVCTDVIQDGNSLLKETTETGGSNSNVYDTSSAPTPPPVEDEVLDL